MKYLILAFVLLSLILPATGCGSTKQTSESLAAAEEHSNQPIDFHLKTVNGKFFYSFREADVNSTDWTGFGGGSNITWSIGYSSIGGQSVDTAKYQVLAEGGQSPYVWTVKGGSSKLPHGFSFSRDGTLTGHPSFPLKAWTVQVLPSFTVIVTDANGVSDEVVISLSLLIGDIAATPTSTPKPSSVKTKQIGQWLYTLYSAKRSGSSLTVNIGITNIASKPLVWIEDISAKLIIQKPGIVCVDSYNQPYFASGSSSWYDSVLIYPNQTVKGSLKYKLSDYSEDVSLCIGYNAGLFPGLFSLFSPTCLFDLGS